MINHNQVEMLMLLPDSELRRSSSSTGARVDAMEPQTQPNRHRYLTTNI